MSFLERLKKLINTPVEENLTGSEDPAVAVRTLVREMREHLSGARAAYNVISRDERRMGAEVIKLKREVAQWHKKAETALVQKDEVTARKCLRHKIAARKCLAEVQKEHLRLQESCKKLDKGIKLLQRKLKEASAREKAILAKIRRIKRAEFIKEKFPEHKDVAIQMALEELDYDSDRRMYASFLLDDDSLEQKFQELTNDDALVTKELKNIQKRLPEK